MRVQRVAAGSNSVLRTMVRIPDERDKVLERFKRDSTSCKLQAAASAAIVREIAVTHGAEIRLEAGTSTVEEHARQCCLPRQGITRCA